MAPANASGATGRGVTNSEIHIGVTAEANSFPPAYVGFSHRPFELSCDQKVTAPNSGVYNWDPKNVAAVKSYQ